MKNKYVYMLFVIACAVTTMLICASCKNYWMYEILDPRIITFDSNGGSHVEEQKVIKGYRIKVPKNPSRIGFVFDGWYLDNGTFEERWNFNVVPAVGFTLYANWNPETGTEGLSFALIDGGTAYSVSRGTVNSGAVLIPAYYRPNPTSPALPVTAVANSAFNNTDITAVTFAAGSQITTIEAEAFSMCTSLTSVTLPNNLTSIEDYAFGKCPNLTSITISASVTYICADVFSQCPNLTSIKVAANNPNYASEGGILYNKAKTNLLQYPSAKGSITIPAGVTSIGNHAFNSCTSLTSVTFAAGSRITTISDAAFNSCTSLTSINIPQSVTSIGASAFNNCESLARVTFNGTIASANFSTATPFPGDLRAKYLDANGGIGTYTATRASGDNATAVWTKQ